MNAELLSVRGRPVEMTQSVASLQPDLCASRVGRLSGRPKMTKLEEFRKSRGIKPAHLAREAGYSRQHLLQVRLGKRQATVPCVAAVTKACRRLSEENVKASDLFELE